MKAFKALFASEMKLVIRDMNTIFFGVGFSAVFAVILGLIMGNKPAFEGAPYTMFEQSFGAVASIGIAATGFMGVPLALSDYRHRKILKRFKITPVSPVILLLTQLTVNFIISILSLIGVYTVSAVFFGFRLGNNIGGFILAYIIVLFSVYSIGMVVASISPNMKTAELLCSLLYFPMLLLSGATLPYEIMPKILQKASDILPLTQGIKLLKGAALGLPAKNVLVSVVVMLTLIVVCTVVSVRFFRWE
jgi:ABC-2 type transport system permease protein